MYKRKMFFRVSVMGILLLLVLPAAPEELITFDKSDYNFRKKIPLLVKESIFDSVPQEQIEEPLVIISNNGDGKYRYYFYLKEVGNICAAVVYFPQQSQQCWIKISQDTASKELFILGDIQYKEAVSDSLVPLYIWE